MAKPHDKRRTGEGSAELMAELRRRGMTDAEIEAGLRKKKRRKDLVFSAVTSRHEPPESRGLTARYRSGGLDRELCTVDEAAAQLKLHPKTVLRFIHEGRLPATRLGKAYRISRRDLEAFAGLPAQAAAPAEPVTVTSIVDVPGISVDVAQTWARAIPAALNAKPTDAGPVRAEIIHDAQRSHLKIVLVSTPEATANLMRLVSAWVEQLGR